MGHHPHPPKFFFEEELGQGRKKKGEERQKQGHWLRLARTAYFFFNGLSRSLASSQPPKYCPTCGGQYLEKGSGGAKALRISQHIVNYLDFPHPLAAPPLAGCPACYARVARYARGAKANFFFYIFIYIYKYRKKKGKPPASRLHARPVLVLH